MDRNILRLPKNRRSEVVLPYLSLLLAISGTAALFLAPRLWQPEPVLVFRIGVGALLFILFVLAAGIIQVVAWATASVHRRGERALDAAQRAGEEAHRQFIRRLDHEIKNPLTGLRGSLANLQAPASAEERAKAEANARLAVDRLSRLLGDLRKLSDLDDALVERVPVKIDEVVKEMVTAACESPTHRGRTVRVLAAEVPALPLVTGDRDLLGLAVYNLVDNALKFTCPEDGVEVRVHEDGRALILDVADNGPGIATDEQERVFEDLYRGRNAREVDGSGLGLPLVRRIVQLHHGEITLRSQPATARGTVFTIRLPVEHP